MYDDHADTIEDTQICQLSVQDVEQHMLSKPHFAIRLIRQTRRRTDLDGPVIQSNRMA